MKKVENRKPLERCQNCKWFNKEKEGVEYCIFDYPYFDDYGAKVCGSFIAKNFKLFSGL